ncbi:pimeloyl-ACP methyl ester carboxylesterase [Amorphus suaedae]
MSPTTLDQIFNPVSLFDSEADSFGVNARLDAVQRSTAGYVAWQGQMARLLTLHGTALATRLADTAKANQEALAGVGARLLPQTAASDAGAYGIDAVQRWFLYLDTLRERGNIFLAHEAAGQPPVLYFEHETVVDGRMLPRPVNYSLLKILPPEGGEIDAAKRPFVIIDPRAGHGAGIGGFKPDSQVGVAIANGHPVYFVVFHPDPEPGQTLGDVTQAEAEFLRQIAILHPDAPKPVVIGNCQGGWAGMLLAASNPDLTGPLVMNGAPLSYWSGRNGVNPMRYMGGLQGGALPALILSDLGNGKFDGANLVLNFESLNPAKTWWRKYYDLYDQVDTERARFLEFERWWSGFFFMNEAEILWILDNLFIGNKLERGEASFVTGETVDLRRIRQPIVVFASRGDNITPPEQALNWISDLYHDEQEIRVRGQRIIYMIHEDVGHLGIFVSGKVARREHAQIASTIEMIEALAPGLYEMQIVDKEGDGPTARFTVAFQSRTIADVAAHDDGREDEAEFATVARLSTLAEEAYDITARPLVKAMVTPASAEAMFRAHPLRRRRRLLSDRNPAMAAAEPLAELSRAYRLPVGADNPFKVLEHAVADMVERNWDLYRDLRDASYELTFNAIFGAPWMHRLGERAQKAAGRTPVASFRDLPQVQTALGAIDRGGFAEAVIRMMILLAHARGSVRRSRLERSNALLLQTEPFASMSAEERARVIHDQTVIIDFEPDRAVSTLPLLLSDADERRRAFDIVAAVAGPRSEMNPATEAMIDRLAGALSIATSEVSAA